MRELMGRLKPTVNEEKTRICRVPEGHFDFLGYTFGRMYKRTTGKAYMGIEWSGLTVENHSGYPAGLLPPYSVLDLNASIAKGPLTLRAFARNVTDQRAYLQNNTAVDYVSNPPALVQMNLKLLQPRTIGVGFDYSF